MSNRRMLDMCWLSLMIGVCIAVTPRAAAAQELTSAVSGMTGLGQHLDTLTANAAHAATLADDGDPGAMGSLADVNALQMRQLQASTTPSLTQASQVGEALTARLQQATDSLTALIPSWRSMTASTDPTIANSMAVMSDSTQKLVQGVKAGIDAATKLVSASVRSSGDQAQPILSSLNVVLPKLSSQLSSLSGVLGGAATSPTATQLRASASKPITTVQQLASSAGNTHGNS
ncbi:hypothetical protein HaLaN_05165 [Haematococcus lacustris]|uniref:Uncharacterized protein n=1 Tax=Haematococcus lacustris TaxID=44745 RepID=A0A699YT00_HAELA|nr:hypothetical protein HaLaN_05165 [Haematococcus lacustris]